MKRPQPRPAHILFQVLSKHYRYRRILWWGRWEVYWVVVEQKILKPGVNKMNPVTVNVGHSVTCAIVYLDQNNNPMLVTPTPDSPPNWTDAPNPAGCTTFAVAADSMSAVDTAVAAGTDVVSLSLAVGGVTFTATLPITVAVAPQVLTSVQIGAVVN